MFGLFQEWGQTSNQSPKLKIAGKWVFPTRTCNLDGLNPGMQVEYETHMGGNKGTLPILDRIRPAPRQDQGPGGPSNGSSSAQTGTTITDGDILRSVSNIVGNACAAGKIDDPLKVHLWVNATYDAFTNMGKAQASADKGPAPKEPEHEFDDSHEFANNGRSEDIPPW